VLFNWNEIDAAIPDIEEVNKFINTYKCMNRVSNTIIFNDISLSNEQEEVLKLLKLQISSKNSNSNIKCMKRIIVMGKAGTGKSTLIHKMYSEVYNTFGVDSIEIAAPTGMAAINIKGNTLHSLFKLPLQTSTYKPLTPHSTRQLQLKFKNLKFIIIDEMSLIGARMLSQIEKRCREMFPNSDEPFGGLCVYLFGDFRQLPPVKDAPLHTKYSMNKIVMDGIAAFQSFKKVFELKICQRQITDNSGFADLLERIARGQMNDEDFNALKSRRKAILNSEEIKDFEKAIYLLPTNDKVNEINNKLLRETGNPIARIVAENVPNIKGNNMR